MDARFIRRVIVVPAAVFLSAVFGGAYGSGREVVEFISRHGPTGGLITILVIAGIYVCCLFLVYELARISGETEVRGFARQLLGRLAWLYELLIGIGLLLSLAICAAAGGAIASSYFGVTEMGGGLGILLLIVVLTFFGQEVVENSMTMSVSALGILLVYLLFTTISEYGQAISTTFASAPASTGGFLSAVKYALTVCGFLPLLLYSASELRSRSEMISAVTTAGLVAVLPAVAFHLTFMSRFPEIIEQPLPTYWLFEQIMPASFLLLYVIVVFVLIAQTGVALLQGVIESIDQAVESSRGKPLSPVAHAAISAVSVAAAMWGASIGIVALIIRVFDFLSVAFLLVFFLPLFTRGAYLIWRNGPKIQ